MQSKHKHSKTRSLLTLAALGLSLQSFTGIYLAQGKETSCCTSWEAVSTEGEPLARHEAAFVNFEGKFYLLGGRRIQPVSIYDPETNSWSEGAAPPIEIHHFQPVVSSDAILIAGAMTGPYPGEDPVDRLLYYYPKTDSWEWGVEIPEDRRRGSTGNLWINDKLYLFCGIQNGHIDGHVAWVDVWDSQSNRWSKLADAPRARDHFQCAMVDGKIYLAGGRRSSKATNQVFELVIPEVDVFDLETGLWSTLAEPLPTPRAGNSTFALNHDVIVAGGESITQKQAHREVEAWDTVLKHWKNYPSLKTGRHGTGILLHQQYIYTCSGSGNRGGQPELTSMERLKVSTAVAHEKDGFVEVEAELFAEQTKHDIRKWYIIDQDTDLQNLRDLDENHASSASGNAYIEILPDTRINHSEKLINGENFSNTPGQLGIISYPIHFETPGRYWIWVSGFSTGTEDNGLHVGINGDWPESGQRVQWCEGKQQWTWSSAQRVDHNHCGYPKTIYLDIPTAGVHTIQFSMREDGVEVDRFIMVNEKQFTPEGFNMPDKEAVFKERIMSNGNIQLGFETVSVQGCPSYYKDYARSAFAINAANVENRQGYAKASAVFPGPTGKYSLQLVTLKELDGESSYRISVNDEEVATFQNAQTKKDYQPARFKTEEVQLTSGDTISVEACAHTNGKIPENGGTAWARGRWQKLIATPVKNHVVGDTH